MSVAAPKPRLTAPRRRAAAYVLAAFTLALTLLSAASGLFTSLPAAPLLARALVAPRLTAPLVRSARSAPSPSRRGPAAGLVTNTADEKADLASRAPTPTSAVRPRGDGGWGGRLVAPPFGLDPAPRNLALSATVALLLGALVARIAALHARAVQVPPAREPNLARGPPQRALSIA